MNELKHYNLFQCGIQSSMNYFRKTLKNQKIDFRLYTKKIKCSKCTSRESKHFPPKEQSPWFCQEFNRNILKNVTFKQNIV